MRKVAHVNISTKLRLSPYSIAVALKYILILVLSLLLPSFVFADGRTNEPSHQTLFSNVITSYADANAVTIADAQGLVVTTGNVGIGTTGPGEKLEVAGNVYVTGNDNYIKMAGGAARIHTTYSGGNGGSFFFDNWYNSAYATRLAINDAGNVGIGTTSPQYPLDVKGPGGIRLSDGSNNLLTIIPSTSGVTTFNTNNGGGGAQGQYVFETRNGGTTLERMRIDSVGRVFIGGTTTGDSSSGLHIDQSTDDGVILALKSSTDVAHGATTIAETNTFGLFKKIASGGGLRVEGLHGGGARQGILLDAYYSFDTTDHTTTSNAALEANVYKISGTGVTNPATNQNLFAVRGNSITKFIVDQEGDTYQTGGATFNGNVGIGTTSPAYSLDIKPDSSNNALQIQGAGGFLLTVGGSAPNLVMNTGGYGIFYGSAISNVRLGSTADTSTSIPIVARGAASQTADLQQWRNSANTVLALVSASGNVGIGTTDPTLGMGFTNRKHLTVTSSADMPLLVFDLQDSTPAGTATGAVMWTTSANSASQKYIGEIGTVAVGSSAPFGGDIWFSTRNTAGTWAEKMRITSSGNVGIGTSSPANILTVVQSSVTDPIADAWTTYSSRRWKTNITKIGGAMEKVLNLDGVSFNWKSDGRHDIGLIAEDVGKIVPEAVAYEGNSTDAKSIDYDKLVPLLIESVKELEQDNNELEARIATLESNTP